MTLRYALLGVLEARPMTGYELAQFFDGSTSWVWSAPHSNIYPQLRKMEEEGLLSSHTEIRGERLERTVYTISKTGIEELRRWVASDPGPVNQRDPLFLRAIFFDMVATEDAEAMLEEFIERQGQLVKDWQEQRDALLRMDTPLIRERLKRRAVAEHDRIATLKANVFQGMIDQAKERIRWARRTIQVLHDTEEH
jgi:DNA-binding PadR family transcriptional regulator